jgi:hypothetical protein
MHNIYVEARFILGGSSIILGFFRTSSRKSLMEQCFHPPSTCLGLEQGSLPMQISVRYTSVEFISFLIVSKEHKTL